MYENFTIFFLALFYEIDCIVEDTLNVFFVVIFQVVALVFYTLLLIIVFTVISCTIDYMCDAKVLERFNILCN